MWFVMASQFYIIVPRCTKNELCMMALWEPVTKHQHLCLITAKVVLRSVSPVSSLVTCDTGDGQTESG